MPMRERLPQRHFWWYQGPMLFWALALFTQSSVPGHQIPGLWVFSYDKVIHFFLYVIFALTVQRGLTHQQRWPVLMQHPHLATLVLVSLYGASDELHQAFVPLRSCSVEDWLADTLGGVAVVGGRWLREHRRAKRAVSVKTSGPTA
jgi:VanZ family protein